MKTFFSLAAFIAVLVAIFWAPAWMVAGAFAVLAILNPS